jgi:uncharacterized protein (DUF2147 family)
VTAFSQKASDDFSGKWKTDEGGTIEISKKDGGFIGIGVTTKKLVIKDLQFKNGKWVSEIRNPLKDITANGEFILEGNKLKIIARKAFFSKTLYWIRLN